MINDLGESKVTVTKVELLDAIRKNREQHKESYEAAATGYRDAAIVALGKALKEAKAGGPIVRALGIVEPTEHIKDYDRIIRMLEMSTADSISITEHQFSQYVLDEWNWKAAFVGTTSLYNGKR